MNEPSKFYRRHHMVEAPVIDDREFRPFWRVRTRLDQLLFDGAISFSTWRAGVTFRTLAEIVLAGEWKISGTERGDGDGVNFGVVLARRVDALDRIHRIRAELGGFAVNILEAHLVEDATWVQLAKSYDVHPKTVREWTIVTLRALHTVIWK